MQTRHGRCLRGPCRARTRPVQSSGSGRPAAELRRQLHRRPPSSTSPSSRTLPLNVPDSSAPTVFAARRANTRSIMKQSRGLAPPWCARCDRPIRQAAALPRRPRHARIGRMDRARAGARRRSAGAEITTAGVIPTPAVAYVTRAMGFDAGIVISASHNPFEDNGIKVFSGRGEKFTEALEREVEAIVADASWEVGGQRRCARGSQPTSSTPTSRTRGSRFRDPQRLGRIQDRGRHGQRRDDDGRADGCSASWASTSHADRRVARRPQHQPRLRLDASASCCREAVGERAAAWASRSTATATARSSSMHDGRVVDGDAVLLMCARQMKARAG